MNYISGRVSVLIPLYNRVDYIQEALESVLQQNYADIEVIIVDDGSTDGSDKIVSEYAARDQVVMLQHPDGENKGQSASLNLALKHASGEYIAILDSDDLFVPGKIAKQVDFLKNNKEIGLVYGNGQAIDAQGKFLYDIVYDSVNEKSDPNEVLLDCYFLLPQNSLVRVSAYKAAGFFDEQLRAAQDHDMLVRLAEVTKFAHIPIDGFRYRRHNNSISVTGAEKRWRCGLLILNKASARYPYKKRTLRKRRAVVNFRLSQALFSSRKSKVEATLRLFYSFLLDPLRAFNVLLGFEKIT